MSASIFTMETVMEGKSYDDGCFSGLLSIKPAYMKIQMKN